MDKIKIAVVGANGRMGKAIVNAVRQNDNAELTAVIMRKGHKDVGENIGGVSVSDNVENALVNVDAVIDFTLPEYSVEIAQAAKKAGVVDVIGTTGFSDAQMKKIEECAQTIPMIVSGNFSLGVNVLAMLVEQAARALDDYDIEISEMHHRNKVDAPSGTALMLGESAAAGRGIDMHKNSERGRDGHTGKRGTNTIGFSSVRGGGVIGEHNVQFANEQEILELGHRALNRELFAQGAVVAAVWGHGQKAGKYDMQDVLGEKIKKATK